MLDKKTFQLQLQKIEELVRTIEGAADPNVRASAIELMQSLMELYGEGFERMMEIVFDSGPDGGSLLASWRPMTWSESLLLLHGLHPSDPRPGSCRPLESPSYLQSHKGNVELLGITDGVVRLSPGKLRCGASSAMTLKLAIEEAHLYEKAPTSPGLEVEGVVEETGRRPRPIGTNPKKRPRMAATGGKR